MTKFDYEEQIRQAIQDGQSMEFLMSLISRYGEFQYDEGYDDGYENGYAQGSGT